MKPRIALALLFAVLVALCAFGQTFQRSLPFLEKSSPVAVGHAVLNGPLYVVMDRLTNEAFSVDSITWISNSVPQSGTKVDIAWGAYNFVALAADTNYCLTSDDGTNWVRSSVPANASWQSACFGSNDFIAVAWGAGTGGSSEDGTNWVSRNFGSSTFWDCVRYGTSNFVAIAHFNPAGNRYFSTSPDGTNWAAQAVFGAARAYYSLAYGNGLFVALENGASQPDLNTRSAVSTDNGTNWSEYSLAGNKTYADMAYGNGLFVAVAGNAAYAITSANGQTWYNQGNITAGATTGWIKIIFAGGRFVTMAENTSIIATSTDGTNWTQRALPFSSSWRAVGYGYR